jgi:hypothetical protein
MGCQFQVGVGDRRYHHIQMGYSELIFQVAKSRIGLDI